MTGAPNSFEEHRSKFITAVSGAIYRLRWVLITLGIILVLSAAAATVFFGRCAKEMDRYLRAGAFKTAANIYAADVRLTEGDGLTAEDLAADLRMLGYTQSSGGGAGTFRSDSKSVEIFPSNQTTQPIARIRFDEKHRIARIDVNGARTKALDVGYPLLANLSVGRERRQMVSFAQIPPVLVHAIVSAEDKHFFQHSGLDLARIIKAAYVDIQSGRKEQGASTLTMQLVRGLWLRPHKSWRRKLAEAAMTVDLERKWSKEKIFATYANLVYFGEQASFSIHGFAAASQMFFGKNIRDLTLPEAALLAGVVQRPSYLNPYRYPQRATERRNLVLAMMRDNRYITEGEYRDAVDTPLQLVQQKQDRHLEAPYILDRVADELRSFDQANNPAKNVYTTIDLNLQRAARQAIDAGMAQVDKLLARRIAKTGAHPEAALIALDPHTGEIKAMIGGRDYGQSQFNRVLAQRPPGSVFKPFVYAAALDTAVSGGNQLFTPASTVDDSPISFWANGKLYQPSNFHNQSFGTLTFRQALAYSDNIAAIKVAQEVGYRNVVQMARRAGFNDQIGATPSVALGSYAVTPLEVAGAYTVFANEGRWVKPRLVSRATGVEGESSLVSTLETRQALDQRVAYLMVSMLEEVMRSGTAAGVRSRGFLLPAAGKTGTSHDGWFAGFTSNLLCVVWVGFDDYSQLDLEGAKSALPIWTDFMKMASQFGAYRNAQKFKPPVGVVSVPVCNDTGLVAGPQCTRVHSEYFVSGSEPSEHCNSHALVSVDLPAQDFPQANSIR